jgi:predicted enzyme related to lactoylglutathione lyase
MARSGAPPVGRLGWIQIDCPDPERLALFWAEVLGSHIDFRLGDPPQFVNVAPTEHGAPSVSFQRVPEPKTVKNRVHLDLLVDDVDDVDEASARVEGLGGRRRDDHDFHEHGFSWRRMADPEGNEFCLVFGVQETPGRTPHGA